MEVFTLQFVGPLLAGVFSLAMGFAVWRVEKRNVTYQYFFAIMAAVGAWSFFVAMFHVPGLLHDTWTMLHWVTGFFIAPAYLLFLVHFPSPRHIVKLPLRILFWLGAGAMSTALLLWPEQFLRYYEVGVHEIPKLSVGPFAWVVELYSPLYFIPGFFFAGRKLLQAYGRARAHILTGLSGLAIASIGALTTNVTLAIHAGREFIWLGPLFGAIAPASLAYMLFGLREGQTRLFPSVALGTVVLFVLAWRLVISGTAEDFVLNGIIFVGVILLFIFLFRTSLLEAADVRRFQDLSRRLQRANEELKKADRVKSEFLAIVSHHLRTPLTHIKWALTELSQGSYGAKLAPEQQKLTRELLENNERLVVFIESLMDTSRIEAGKMYMKKSAVEIQQVLAEVVESFQESAEKYYLVDIEVIPSAAPIPAVQGDRELISKVFENLIENALVYNKPGGKVYIETEAENNLVKVKIVDTGIGIAKQDLQRVGEKFFRASSAKKQVAEGTGLGIFIARHIAKLHGGNVSLRSEQGKGTTVTVQLPVARRLAND